MTGYPATPSPEQKKRPAWVVGAVSILTFVALMWIVEAFDSVSGHRLDNNGIRPLESDGLLGILYAPLLPADCDHLAPRRVRHVADRQHRRALPLRRRALRDQPHRCVRADLRLAGLLDRVRVLHPQGVGDRG